MMIVHGYLVNESAGFICTKGKSKRIFNTYDEALVFIQKNYGYILTYKFFQTEEE